jgi:hypothetical protein
MRAGAGQHRLLTCELACAVHAQRIRHIGFHVGSAFRAVKHEVGGLILRETGLTISERSTGKYLKRWGFSPQKPIKRAYEQSPKAVQSWLDEKYPAIQERDRAEGTETSMGRRDGLGQHRQ